MTKDEYLQLQTLIVNIRRVVGPLAFADFLAELDRADAVSFFVDPTLAREAMDEVPKIRALVKAVMEVQACELPQYVYDDAIKRGATGIETEEVSAFRFLLGVRP